MVLIRRDSDKNASRHSPFVLSILAALVFGFSFGLLLGIDQSFVWHHGSRSLNAVEQSDDILDNVTYSQLRRAVLNKYFASEPHETNVRHQFKTALQAMDLVERDGEPIAIKNFPYLYVGGVGAAYNLEALKREGITHIVNLSPSARPKFPDHITYLHLDSVHDSTSRSQRISPIFKVTNSFIEQARLAGGKIYIHCWYGVSRSVTVLIAYLMRYHGMAPEEALDLIQMTRTIAKPNKSYMKELVKYQEMVSQMHQEKNKKSS